MNDSQAGFSPYVGSLMVYTLNIEKYVIVLICFVCLFFGHEVNGIHVLYQQFNIILGGNILSELAFAYSIKIDCLILYSLSTLCSLYKARNDFFDWKMWSHNVPKYICA